MKKLLIIVILAIFSILPVMAQDNLGMDFIWNNNPFRLGNLGEYALDWPISICIDDQGRCWYAAQENGVARLTILGGKFKVDKIPEFNYPAYHVTYYAGKIVLNSGGAYVFEPNTFEQIGYFLGYHITWSAKKNNRLFCLTSSYNEQSQRKIGVHEFNLNEFTKIFDGLSETRDADRGHWPTPGRSLAVDDSGRVWAGNYSGLYRYDPRDDELERISDRKLNGFYTYIRDLHYDSATKTLFIATTPNYENGSLTDGGLVIWNLKTNEIQKINWDDDIGIPFSHNQHDMRVLMFTSKFATLGRVLIIAGSPSWTMLTYHMDQKRFVDTHKIPESFEKVRALAVDANEENPRLWVACEFKNGGGGIDYFNIKISEDGSKLIFPPNAPKVTLTSADTSWIDSTSATITANFEVESDTGVYVEYKIMEDNLLIKENQFKPVAKTGPTIVQSLEISFTAKVETDYNIIFCAFDPISGLTSDWCQSLILFRLDALVPEPPEPPPILPTQVTLSQNYPNPFNPETTIEYYLPEASHVRINVYNILGQLITTLVDEHKEAGDHMTNWNGRDTQNRKIMTGIYFYQIVVIKYGLKQTKRMFLTR